MKKSGVLFLLALSVVLASHIREEVNLSGTITNQAKFPVKNLEVSMKKLGIMVTTNEKGEFKIYKSITALHSKKKGEGLFRPTFSSSQFTIPVHRNNQNVTIQIFDVKGSQLIKSSNYFTKGMHRITLFKNRNIASSVLIALITRGSEVTKMQIVKSGNNTFNMGKVFHGSSHGGSSLTSASTPAIALDSIRFIRRLKVEGKQKEFVEFVIPVTKYQDKFEVKLDLIPYEAVEWGKTQEGRSNETVGKELGKPGSGTYPYEFQTYYNGAWCSEFYSYCMRIGGYPLGSDEGSTKRPKWLVGAHTSLEKWFTKNAKFVKKSEIGNDFVPVPGDFIHMDKHTTMVRYIAENGDCYCLDGNWGDKVLLINRGNYKSLPKKCKQLHGYGRRSGIMGNSYKSISFPD